MSKEFCKYCGEIVDFVDDSGNCAKCQNEIAENAPWDNADRILHEGQERNI